MKKFLSDKLISLADSLFAPLYIVGGACRDFVLGDSLSKDIDLASPTPISELLPIAKSFGFSVLAEYPRTSTLVLFDGQRKYEYTCFRREVYANGGEHTPISTEFTDSVLEDACRRDFKCNALYYDIKQDKFVDPLNAMGDIKNKVISTTISPSEVFSHDGLRLLRLARFSAELNFKIDEKTLLGAKENADKIKDISVERIFEELKKILVADSKHSFSDKRGHYNGLKVLDKIGVLDIILPELTLGRNLVQPKKYHDHDVLEHSLRAVLYSPAETRLCALLHDVGKPYCYHKHGNYYFHADRGEKIARTILNRLKAPKLEIDKICFSIKHHMLDFSCVREVKIRRLIAGNLDFIQDLISLKNADAKACRDLEINFLGYDRFVSIFNQMKTDGTPFSLGDLKISSRELMELGYEGKELGAIRKKLRDRCVDNPTLNSREILIKMAKSVKNN
ncbi:MAG: CCA tRNA nucleotidyltransferase [Clostridia bacterium]|nr:CCA tRNA nucleotidyltransferase [Clostridia bacterium]